MGRYKEIKYGVEPRIYEKGVYKGYTYYIVEGFMNPCAYVVLPKGGLFHRHPLYKKNTWDVLLPVHGGTTYLEGTFYLDDIGKKNFIIGWDYAHAGDFIYFDPALSEGEEIYGLDKIEKGHRYTRKEIYSDITYAIDFIEEAYK